jgi:hypothetical protein
MAVFLIRCHLPQRGRTVSVTAMIAVVVTTEGRREIVGRGNGPSDA